MSVWVRVGGREGSTQIRQLCESVGSCGREGSTQIIQLCERVGSCGREGGIDADNTTM